MTTIKPASLRSSKIKWRRAPADAWTAINPVLEVGEPGYEEGTGKFKIGDGETPWSGLLYSGGDGGVGEEEDPVAGAAITAHIADETGAHEASAISVDGLSETDVQAMLSSLSEAVERSRPRVEANETAAASETLDLDGDAHVWKTYTLSAATTTLAFDNVTGGATVDLWIIQPPAGGKALELDDGIEAVAITDLDTGADQMTHLRVSILGATDYRVDFIGSGLAPQEPVTHVAAPPMVVTLSAPAPGLVVPRTIAAPPMIATFSAPAPQIAGAVNITAPAATVTFSAPAPVITIPTDYATQVLARSGLLRYFRLGESSGSVLTDSSTAAVNGVYGASTAAPTLGVAGAISGGNTAASFDGSNDYASAAINMSALNIITVVFWLKWTSFSNNDDLAMEFTPTINSGTGGFMVDPNAAAGNFQIVMSGNNSVAFTRPSAGAFHHYAVVMDRTVANSLTITPYVDAVAVSYTKPGSAGQSGNFANDTLYLMSRNAASLFGAGVLDELAIYDRALSAGEIAADFAAA